MLALACGLTTFRSVALLLSVLGLVDVGIGMRPHYLQVSYALLLAPSVVGVSNAADITTCVTDRAV